MLSGLKVQKKEDPKQRKKDRRKEQKKRKKEKKKDKKKDKSKKGGEAEAAAGAKSSSSDDEDGALSFDSQADDAVAASKAIPGAAAIRPPTALGDPQENNREKWMTKGPASDADFFSSMGSERKREDKMKPDPDKAFISEREYNPTLRGEISEQPEPEESGVIPKHLMVGDGGTAWRRRARLRATEPKDEAEESKLDRDSAPPVKVDFRTGEVGKPKEEDEKKDAPGRGGWRKRAAAAAAATTAAALREHASRSPSRRRRRSPSERRDRRRKSRSRSKSRSNSNRRRSRRSRSRSSSERRQKPRGGEGSGWRRKQAEARRRRGSRSRSKSRSRSSPSPKRPSGAASSGAAAKKTSAAAAAEAYQAEGTGETEMEDVLERMRKKYASSAETAAKAEEDAAAASAAAAVAEEDAAISDDPNKLGAMAMEAMLCGDMERYEELTRRLERAQAALAKEPAEGEVPRGATVRTTATGVKVIEELDSTGRNRALKESVHTTFVRLKGRNKRGTANAVPGKGGNLTGYFEDDDISLNDLLKKEKIEGVQDYDANLSEHILKKGAKFKMLHEDEDEAYALGWYEHSSKKMDAKKLDEKQRRQQIRDKQRIQVNLEHCTRCMDSKRFGRKDAIASMAEHTYLCMDGMNQCIVEGQCFIAPIEHIPAVTDMDDPVWTEIRNYQKCLVRYFEAENPPRAVIFAETVNHRVSRDKAMLGAGPHTFITAYPVDLGLLDEVRAFWKKALDEVESEFEVQHKKVIETDARSGVRGKVPKNFLYVHADFSMGGGFAHVIENSAEFPKDFVQHTIAGMCELTILDRAYPDRESYRAATEDFKKRFGQGFDWAQALKPK